jgi:hypothetical protein
MIIPIPTPQQRREIAARALCDRATVRKVYLEPLRAQPSSVERVRRAARALGIPEPLVPEPIPAAAPARSRP